nr:hypothetical protein [Tanacetum cinerariifolium]
PEAEGADVELEAEEPDGVPEAVIGAGSQRPFAIRDFPMGVYEIGESSTAREPQFISECKEKDRVKFAMATLRGRALTW